MILENIASLLQRRNIIFAKQMHHIAVGDTSFYQILIG